jgi:hypothetical protein
MDDGSGGGDNGGWVNVVDKWTGVADITGLTSAFSSQASSIAS